MWFGPPYQTGCDAFPRSEAGSAYTGRGRPQVGIRPERWSGLWETKRGDEASAQVPHAFRPAAALLSHSQQGLFGKS